MGFSRCVEHLLVALGWCLLFGRVFVSFTYPPFPFLQKSIKSSLIKKSKPTTPNSVRTSIVTRIILSGTVRPIDISDNLKFLVVFWAAAFLLRTQVVVTMFTHTRGQTKRLAYSYLLFPLSAQSQVVVG